MKIYFAGMPTSAEVGELEKAFSVLEPGQDILYEEIESVIHHKANTNRFRTVTSRWRKLVRSQRFLVIEAIAGVGFHVQTPTEQLAAGVKDYGRSARGLGRAFRKVSEVSPEALSPVKRAEQEHIRRVMSYGIDGVQKSRREMIKPPSAIAGLPHAAPPDDRHHRDRQPLKP